MIFRCHNFFCSLRGTPRTSTLCCMFLCHLYVHSTSLPLVYIYFLKYLDVVDSGVL